MPALKQFIIMHKIFSENEKYYILRKEFLSQEIISGPLTKETALKMINEEGEDPEHVEYDLIPVI